VKLATANGESVSRRINPRDILLFGKKSGYVVPARTTTYSRIIQLHIVVSQPNFI